MGVITIACIGSGNMGFALMKGASASAGGVKIGFTDIDSGKAEAAAAAVGGTVFGSNTEAAEKSGFIFLAVKPDMLQRVLAEISPVVQRRSAVGDCPVLVSIAAGWPISKIQDAVGMTAAGKTAIVRIMPNTPALVSKGMIVCAVSPGMNGEQKSGLETILKGAGVFDIIDESYFDAVTGLSGSGPAFAYLFIEALADGGVRAGLPRDKALRYAAQTVFGSAAMVMETGRHPGELKDMVCSPGGTTIAGVEALESCAFRGTVMQAVKAAWEKAKRI